jgi:hypothetical protein
VVDDPVAAYDGCWQDRRMMKMIKVIAFMKEDQKT